MLTARHATQQLSQFIVLRSSFSKVVTRRLLSPPQIQIGSLRNEGHTNAEIHPQAQRPGRQSIPPFSYVYTDSPIHTSGSAKPRPRKTPFEDLDIPKAYQELRRVALDGNGPLVQQMVQTLVQGRGEKPNARIYEALLLANADEDHGSAAEAARLLDEMTSQGIVAESFIYHAVLRVSSLRLQPFAYRI